MLLGAVCFFDRDFLVPLCDGGVSNWCHAGLSLKARMEEP